jgi:gluconokinase
VSNVPLVWLMMGVSGSGKTAIGRILSDRLESDFLEGDRRQSHANILKMISQIPLQDEDRHQWLMEIEADIQRAVDLNRETVMTCSALKKSYRRQLVSHGRVQLVWLEVPTPELERRLAQRPDHYMKPGMLCSQLEAFEAISPDENAIAIDATSSPAEIVTDLLNKATVQFPDLAKPWWERSFD